MILYCFNNIFPNMSSTNISNCSLQANNGGNITINSYNTETNNSNSNNRSTSACASAKPTYSNEVSPTIMVYIVRPPVDVRPNDCNIPNSNKRKKFE